MIIDSQPLTVALLASLLFAERLGALGFLGMGLGVVGLCLLEVPPDALQGKLSCSLIIELHAQSGTVFMQHIRRFSHHTRCQTLTTPVSGEVDRIFCALADSP